MTKGWDGIKIYNGHHIVIRNNYIHKNLGQGILGNGHHILIDCNTISHNGFGDPTIPDTSSMMHGIYMSGQNIIITNNIIHSNRAYGIQVAGYPYDSSSHSGVKYAGAKYWLIANNVFAYNYNRAGMVVWQSDANTNTISNNIFFNNVVNEISDQYQGIDFLGAGSNNVMNNNLFYSSNNTPAISDTANGASYIESNNIYNQMPRFISESDFNFRLLPSSPAIDAGVNLRKVRRDCDGTLRPEGAASDIGAYEYKKSNNPVE
jgi:hypothetical protein